MTWTLCTLHIGCYDGDEFGATTRQLLDALNLYSTREYFVWTNSVILLCVLCVRLGIFSHKKALMPSSWGQAGELKEIFLCDTKGNWCHRCGCISDNKHLMIMGDVSSANLYGKFSCEQIVWKESEHHINWTWRRVIFALLEIYRRAEHLSVDDVKCRKSPSLRHTCVQTCFAGGLENSFKCSITTEGCSTSDYEETFIDSILLNMQTYKSSG